MLTETRDSLYFVKSFLNEKIFIYVFHLMPDNSSNLRFHKKRIRVKANTFVETSRGEDN